MKRKNFYRFINNKALLIAGLIALVFCMTFTSCDLPEENEVTSFTLNQTSINMWEGDIDYLYVVSANAAYQSVTYKSDDTSIVTVDAKGIVKLPASFKPGETNIRVTIGKVTVPCKVKVETATSNKLVTGVTLVTISINMTVGGNADLSAKVTPSDAAKPGVFYISDNTNVAKVDAGTGKVTAVATGTAKITVTTKNRNKTDVCNVTVQAPAAVPVTGVTLSPTTLTLAVGTSGDLTASVQPATATNKTIFWDSSNDDVATVDENGKVTAKAKGTAVIWATSQDGGKFDKCNVTVNDAAITGTITLSKNLFLLKGGTATLTATGIASGTAVTWSSSDTNIATVTGNGVGGNVTATQTPGTATITAAITGGTSATCTVTVLDPKDPTAFYGTYTAKYSNNTVTETIVLTKTTFHIEDTVISGANAEFLDFAITEWDTVTTHPSATNQKDYPIVLKITGKITGAKPDKLDLYGSLTSAGFSSADFNETTCTMYFYVSNNGTFVRTPFSSSKNTQNNGVAPVAMNSTSNKVLRVYTKTATTP